MKFPRIPVFFYFLTFYVLTVFILSMSVASKNTQIFGVSWPQIVILFFVSVFLVRSSFSLIVGPWYDVRLAKLENKFSKQSETYNPKVSVLIPAWNEEVGIIQTIESVLNNTYENFELIVVNDGSTDGSHQKILDFLQNSTSREEIEIKYHYKKNEGKAVALNTAISQASGDIFLTIDGDCVVDKNAIENFVKIFCQKDVMAVAGNIRIGNNDTFWGVVQSIEYLLSFYLKKVDAFFGTMYIMGGAAAAFRREVFDQIGLFSPDTVTEDIDLTLRIQAAGMKIAYAPDAVIYTEGANNLSDLIKQRLRWRWGKFYAYFKHRQLFFSSEKRHNKLLTWITLPASILNDVQIIFEPLFLGFLLIGSVYSGNAVLLANSLLISSFIFLIKVFFDRNDFRNLRLYFLVPIVWCVSYFATLVEYLAFAKLFLAFIRKKDVKWQRWERQGINLSNTLDNPRFFRGADFYIEKLLGYFSTAWVIAFIVITTGYFYTQIIAHENIFGSFILGVVFLSASTDGFFLLMNIFRKPVASPEASFDPSKVSILIACYNGEKVIPETIRQAATKVPLEQIFVISDASTDQTVSVARSLGVNVIENEMNMNKALSISNAIHHIKTPYVLILDDDTHIEKTSIPSGLLDDGYSAVAFNVMPEPQNTLLNRLQQFEYRKSMVLSKELRASVGAIGNVSGAIGLFKTQDLVRQAKKHSGQFGGEDQQRTMMVHLENSGKGIAYTGSTVLTEPPTTFRKLFRQRYRSWNCSTHETFFLCWQIILTPRLHYMLKLERGYLIFILLTDPLRMLFVAGIFFFPLNFLILYIFYLFLEIACWIKTGRKDSIFIVLITPLYGIFKTIARFIAHFWWFRLKYDYLVKKKLHKYITERALIFEYAIIAITLMAVWLYSAYQFVVHFRAL